MKLLRRLAKLGGLVVMASYLAGCVIVPLHGWGHGYGHEDRGGYGEHGGYGERR